MKFTVACSLLLTLPHIVQAQDATCLADTEAITATADVSSALEAVLASTMPEMEIGDDEIEMQIAVGAEATTAFETACLAAPGEYHVEATHMVCPATNDGAETEIHVDLPLILCLASTCTEEDEEELAHERLEEILEAAIADNASIVVTGECEVEGHDEHDHDHGDEKSSAVSIGVATALVGLLGSMFFLL